MGRLNALILGLFLVSPLLAAEPVRVSMIEGSPVSDICSAILKEIYLRAGLELEVIPMPALRATYASTTGKTDGETHRIASYGDTHGELVIVPVSYYTSETAYFATRAMYWKIAAADDLTGFRVGYLRGVANAELLTRAFPRREALESSEQLMELLDSNRLDLVLLSKVNGEIALRRLGLDGIVACDPPIEATELYHYLNTKRGDLVPLLEKTMRELKKNGELKAITERAERQVMGNR